jgi:hypothetical protein
MAVRMTDQSADPGLMQWSTAEHYHQHTQHMAALHQSALELYESLSLHSLYIISHQWYNR